MNSAELVVRACVRGGHLPIRHHTMDSGGCVPVVVAFQAVPATETCNRNLPATETCNTLWRGRHRSRRCALAHQNPCAAHSSGMQNRAYQSVATPLTKSQRFPTCGTAATRPHALHLLDERLSPGCTFGDGCTTRCYKRHPCNSSAGLVLLILSHCILQHTGEADIALAAAL